MRYAVEIHRPDEWTGTAKLASGAAAASALRRSDAASRAALQSAERAEVSLGVEESLNPRGARRADQLVPQILHAAILAQPWRDVRTARPKRSILMLAAIGAIPIVWYGVGQALMQRNTFPPSADPHHNAHWWAMAVLVVAGILVLGGAGLGLRGWRVGASAVGVSGVAFGVASLVAAEAASAVSLPWSIASILWGLAIFAVQIRAADNSNHAAQ